MPSSALAPDLILVNGCIRTLVADDALAEAVAVKDGRFVAVGDSDEIGALAGVGTRAEDLAGATVVPGLIDPHNHLLSTGLMLGQVQLYDCRSLAEVLARVVARAASLPPGTWIVGRGWDESLLAERRHPTRHDLDTVAPQHPVVLHRVWNKLVANSLALRLAGVGAGTPDPPAGVRYAGSFERDAAGEPTGLFRDRAKELITAHIPAPSEDEPVAAIARACRADTALGLVGVAEPGLYPAELRAYHRAAQEGLLTVRPDLLLAGWGFGPATEEPRLKQRFRDMGVMGGFGDDLLRLGGIKLMVDGGIGDRTAKVSAPYAGEPDNTGTWVIDPAELPHLIRWVHDLGWSLDCHTCGDVAQEAVVRAMAAAQLANPQPHLRHRVHHAYFPTPAALDLMAAHRIPALVSSPFLTHLGESCVAALGVERAARAMPARTYLATGVPLAGSSDSPIADFNPWVGMQALTTRTTVAGRALGAEERLTPAQALRAYTAGAAVAIGAEAQRGTIAVGKLADLVVLDRDPVTTEPADLAAIRPLATLLGGRWVADGL